MSGIKIANPCKIGVIYAETLPEQQFQKNSKTVYQSVKHPTLWGGYEIKSQGDRIISKFVVWHFTLCAIYLISKCMSFHLDLLMMLVKYGR